MYICHIMYILCNLTPQNITKTNTSAIASHILQNVHVHVYVYTGYTLYSSSAFLQHGECHIHNSLITSDLHAHVHGYVYMYISCKQFT